MDANTQKGRCKFPFKFFHFLNQQKKETYFAPKTTNKKQKIDCPALERTAMKLVFICHGKNCILFKCKVQGKLFDKKTRVKYCNGVTI